MSSDIPLLTLEQVEQLNCMVHAILQQNKKKLDQILSELVQISSTNILTLYRVVTEQWSKKQKIVENLCHFSLTMMSTVQFLWQQKAAQNERLQTSEIMIGNLQKQLDEVMDINQLYKQKISEAETHIECITEAKEKIEEYVRSQSCVDITQDFEDKLELLANQKCSAYEQHDENVYEKAELIRQSSEAIIEKEAEIQNLREQKKKLQLQLQAAIEQKQLTKMELQLAQIAIQDALTYKSSFKSLIQSSSSKLDDRPRLESNIHYYNGQIDCQSLMDESFKSENKNILSNQFACRQDIIHFASTPCLLLNESVQKIDLNQSVSSLQERMPENPFKKKVSEAYVQPSSNPSKNQLISNEIIQSFDREDAKQNYLQHNKTFDLKNQSKQSSFHENFEPSNYPESVIIDEKRISDLTKKININKRKTDDKQTYESSMISTSPYKTRKSFLNYQKKKKQSKISVNESSMSTFYNFVTKKVVRNRIKVK